MQASEQDLIAAFSDAMAAGGAPCSGTIEADGEFHRFYVDGDKKGTKNGWYRLWMDGRPNGIFGSFKGITRKWSPEGMAPLSEEERERIRVESAARKKASDEREREMQAKAAARANAMWEAATETSDHPYLTRKGVPGYGLRVGDWVKERREDGVEFVAAKGALLIPVRDERKNIVSLQAVFAKPLKVGEDTRDKDFVYGGRKKGCWFTIGKPVDVDGHLWVIICEGYATGASIHRATGLGVVVAFDAKNLVYVAETVRRLMPKARILIASDNDAWTFKADKVTPWNPGVEFAREAAKGCAGEMAVPRFADCASKPTDFNDLEALEGMDSVKDQIMAVISPPAPVEEQPPMPTAAPEGGVWEAVDPDEAHREMEAALQGEGGSGNGHFRILGHDRTNIYVYQFRMKVILSRPMASWPTAALLNLAPLQWWEREFSKGKGGGIQIEMALNWIFRQAEEKGFFDPNCRRGRGAWRDDGRIVYHLGDRLMVDGDLQPNLRIDSSNVYEQARRLRPPSEIALSNADGRRIVEVAKLFHWTRPASAVLWAGWCALAPVCGALSWRPHIWVSAPAGAGKTTVLGVAHWLLNGAAIYAQGNSTEAGIRQTLKIDALPVLFDESEKNNDREAMRVDGILAMIRQSSTESDARTLKGTQGGDAMDFIIRSMFHLSSIQVGMKQQADLERIARLELRSSRTDESATAKLQAAENWRIIKAGIDGLKEDSELPARLMRRAITLLPVTTQNIEVFARAGAEAFGSQRDGDQYGALLAGAWSLVSSKVACLDDARSMIKRYEWGEYRESADTEEGSRALDTLLGKVVRTKSGAEVTILRLVTVAKGDPFDGVSRGEAVELLGNRGMRVVEHHPVDGHPGGSLWVANASAERDRMLADTPYAADLPGQLRRIDGARAGGNAASIQAGEKNKRFTTIPLSAVLAHDAPVGPGLAEVDDDLPF